MSVAEDSSLRQMVRGFALKESRSLDSIGMAQTEQERLKKVVALTDRDQYKMIEETGIESCSYRRRYEGVFRTGNKRSKET